VLKVVGTLVVGAAGFLAQRVGLFSRVRWQRQRSESFSFVFLAHLGPYSSIGPKFEEVEAILGSAAKPVKVTRASHRWVGVYYDDPTSTPAAELRSCAGVILSGAELDAAVNAGLPSRTVAASDTALMATFPLHNVACIAVGASKAYSAIKKQHPEVEASSCGEMYEIYDWAASKLTYLAFPDASTE